MALHSALNELRRGKYVEKLDNKVAEQVGGSFRCALNRVFPLDYCGLFLCV